MGMALVPCSISGAVVMKLPFRDRIHAGRLLARKLTGYSNRNDVIVLALPRGGVPVGFEVAQALGTPLDVFLVRKLGVPGHEELAMGAIASGGVRVLNQDVVERLKISSAVIGRVAASEQRELERRERAYRDGRPVPDVRGKTVILIDDGLATGSTMHAAVAAIRQQQPARIIIAVPTAPPDTCEALRKEVDEVVSAATPEPFHAVGLWYEDFSETTDDEIRTLLERAEGRPARRASTLKGGSHADMQGRDDEAGLLLPSGRHRPASGSIDESR